MEEPRFYNLAEIASWQLPESSLADRGQVDLPALQRSFVWKPNQIELLWDSILRGYPIGSFLLSKVDEKQYQLLDGQQRATSIALGYYDPWDIQDETDDGFWSLKNIPVLWVDLNPGVVTTNQEFVIRAVTRSHPWGYQRLNNGSILSARDRHSAWKTFSEISVNKDKGYVNFD